MAQPLLDAATPKAPPAQHLAIAPGGSLRLLSRLLHRLGDHPATVRAGRLLMPRQATFDLFHVGVQTIYLDLANLAMTESSGLLVRGTQHNRLILGLKRWRTSVWRGGNNKLVKQVEAIGKHRTIIR